MADQRIAVEQPDQGKQPSTASRQHPGRWLLAAGVLVVGIGALTLFGRFGGPDATPDTSLTTTTTSPTTTTLGPAAVKALQYEADVELIEGLWQDQTTAWASGFDRGIQFWVDNNYPEIVCNFDDYMNSWFPNGPIDGWQMERVVDSPTIEADEGWIIPGGRLEGVAAQGRVYVMSVSENVTSPGVDPEPPNTRTYHVTILDGQAHFFIGCPG